jgi:ATP-dependent RNA helicase DeaD
VLARLDLAQSGPQALVLAPTRELAIQVAEAFQKYARHLESFHVLPVYGGADIRGQLRQLKRGVHVVVGTPGRVMDHMRRGSLKLSQLQTLVLDEADEMLRMGFIDDVEWILEQTPAQRQTALFSATMPDAIRRIAKRYLSEPREVSIKVKSVISSSIRQRVWMMSGIRKLDALTRILEVEDFDGVIIFVRTRLLTTELADKLAARGYSVAALNGDIPQKQRELTIERLKRGELDILVATDVAARGLDVARISHVINYDIPYDVEAYVHRIGRTGRAGRTGETILFAANRERRLLRAIEKATGQTIDKMVLPTAEQVTDKRIDKFKQRITETLDTADLELFRKMVQEYQHQYGVPVIEIAAALGALAQGGKPLAAQEVETKRDSKRERRPAAGKSPPRPAASAGPGRDVHDRPEKKSSAQPVSREQNQPGPSQPPRSGAADIGMDGYRLEVGLKHGVKPGNIVGAIANEAEIDSEYIGRIEIFDDYSTVRLPEGMPKEIFKHLKKVWVSGQRLQISRLDQSGRAGSDGPGRGGSDKAAREGGRPVGKKGQKSRKHR